MQDKKTLKFCASVGVEVEYKPRTTTVKFGEGYEQRTGGGLNSGFRKFNVSYNLDKEQTEELLEFLREHGGYKSFYFNEPHTDKKALVVAREWHVTYKIKRGITTVSFDEVAN